MASIKRMSRTKCFAGQQDVYEHQSRTCNTTMRFAVFLPSGAEQGTPKLPALYYLSGLTCTEQNVITKAGAQRYCEEQQIVLICPDTSPRGDGVPDDEAWDLGQGASFYLNATREPWKKHFQMYDYVADELPALVAQHFPVNGKAGIFGHSMGGHGALVLALTRPGQYASVSAFAPMCAPTQCAWGHKAFGTYLGEDREAWKQYDATELLARYDGAKLPLLIDQGKEDSFLKEQLKPELLEAAAKRLDYPLDLRLQPGYDHSYYFIASFMGDHIAHHARALNSQ